MLALCALLAAAPAQARIDPPAGMLPNAGNASLPDALANLGLATVYGRGYGMKCDAVSDDTAALQAAVNAAQQLGSPSNASGGGHLILPPGFCMLSGAVTITTGITVQGSGSGAGSGTGNSGGTVIRTTSATADVFTVTTNDAVQFDNFYIDAPSVTKTAGAGISITGADASHANIASKITRVKIHNMYDAIALGNAFGWKIRDSWLQDYQHDGVKLAASATFHDGSIGGSTLAGTTIVDLNVGTSNADFEIQGGGDLEVIGNKLLGSAYGVLLSLNFGPTGTLVISSNSIEQQRTAGIALTQALAAQEYGDVVVSGNQFSNLGGAVPGQGNVFIGTGTPNTAPKWIHNVAVTGNVVNDAVAIAGGIIQINDGSGVVVANNVLGNNNVAGTPGISVGPGAVNVSLLNNVPYQLPAGLVGQVAPAALVTQTPAPNMLVNPGMDIDQVNEGASVAVSNSGSQVNCADEWQAQFTSAASGITCQRVADAPPGTNYSVKVTIGTGSATVNAGDFGRIQQRIEQTNFITDDLAFGTAAAKTLSLGLWLKSSVTGTFDVALINGLNTRSFIEPCVIAQAATWTYCAWVVPGDTTAAWTGFNGIGMRLYVTLEAGSTFTGGATGAWLAGQLFAASGQTQLSQTTGATIQVSQAKLELSPAPTTFVSRPLQQELALAQRYYAKTFPQGTAPAQNAGLAGARCAATSATTAGTWSVYWPFPVEMRASPTVTTYNPSAANANIRDVTGASDAVVNVDPAAAKGTTGVMLGEQTTALTAAHNLCIHATADARL